MTYSFASSYTSKRKGYNWHYLVYEDGAVAYLERTTLVPIVHKYQGCIVACGGERQKVITNPVITKECLDDIEKKTGRKTDGWHWID